MVAIFLALVAGIILLWKLQTASSAAERKLCNERLINQDKRIDKLQDFVANKLILAIESNTQSNHEVADQLRGMKHRLDGLELKPSDESTDRIELAQKPNLRIR
jgi:hypothetical protein